MTSRNRVSRRSFLLAAAAVPFSAAATERIPGANERIRIGMIGCGQRGMELMDRLTQGPVSHLAEISAVCDVFKPHRDRAATLFSARAFSRWEDLASSRDVDAVVICTPDHWHAPIAVGAMQCGKDVYCELPMALCLKDAKSVRDTAAATGRVLQVGADTAGHGRWEQGRHLVQSSAIGKVVWCQGDYPGCDNASRPAPPGRIDHDTLDWTAFSGRPDTALDPERFVSWNKYWEYSGGPFVARYAEELAGLLTAVGLDLPERVSAAGGVYADDGRETPDCFVMTAEYADGHTIVLASSLGQGRVQYPIIRGTHGTMELHPDGVSVIADMNGLPSQAPRKRDLASEASVDLVADWLDAIRSRRKGLCDEQLAYAITVPVCMALEAYHGRTTLAFDAKAELAVPAQRRALRAGAALYA